jgi:uncharacterized protein YaeQ
VTDDKSPIFDRGDNSGESWIRAGMPDECRIVARGVQSRDHENIDLR